MVDPIHRSQLIQSLCKAPYMKADFLHHIINGKAAEETKNTESNIRVSFFVFSKQYSLFNSIFVSRLKNHYLDFSTLFYNWQYLTGPKFQKSVCYNAESFEYSRSKIVSLFEPPFGHQLGLQRQSRRGCCNSYVGIGSNFKPSFKWHHDQKSAVDSACEERLFLEEESTQFGTN